MKATFLAWLGIVLLFVCVAHGNFETSDAGFTMHAARSLWHRGDSALLTKEQGGELLGEQMGADYIIAAERRGSRINGKIGVNGHAYTWFPMGHVFLLVPFVPLGDALALAMPLADRKFGERVGLSASFIEGQPTPTQAAISLLLPSVCIATTILLLYRLARELGANGRDAAWCALAIGFGTQAFSVGREQLSDGPGLMLMLAAMLPVVRLHRGTGGRGSAIWAGVMSGAAVLVRYQAAFAVIAFTVVLVLACRRRGRFVDLLLFLAGGAPLLAVFLLTNYGRFGNPLDTGYPEVVDWFAANPLAGLGKLLFAAGRGLLWMSPLLWLGLPLAASRRTPLELRWLAWVLLVTPLLLFMGVNGWQGGQCWAARYVTPGVVGLLVIVLPQTTPWRTWPRTFMVLFAFGCFVALTSVIAPVRGVLQLASQAVRAEVAQAVADGSMTAADAVVDPADVAGWRLRYTPLLANWRYALLSHVGGFEDESGQPRDGGEHTIEALYGVRAVTPDHGFAPRRWEDRCGRHLWWRFWGDLYGVAGWLLVLPFAVLGTLCGWFGWRRLAVASISSTPE